MGWHFKGGSGDGVRQGQGPGKTRWDRGIGPRAICMTYLLAVNQWKRYTLWNKPGLPVDYNSLKKKKKSGIGQKFSIVFEPYLNNGSWYLPNWTAEKNQWDNILQSPAEPGTVGAGETMALCPPLPTPRHSSWAEGSHLQDPFMSRVGSPTSHPKFHSWFIVILRVLMILIIFLNQ